MGKFAAVYDLPGGQQLVALLMQSLGGPPMIVFLTEIDGMTYEAQVPIWEECHPHLAKDLMARAAETEEARNAIQNLSEEYVKNIRRRFVGDSKKARKEGETSFIMEGPQNVQ